MKFSIITICKNARESIHKTVDSVLKQKYSNYEYIIIDGASDDGTADIVFSYLSPNVYIISEPDKGIGDAFNKGIKKASGDILLFLNSGDYFIESGILDMVAADIKENQADIYTYSVTSMMNPKWPESKKAGESYWEKSLIPHQSTFIKRNVFKEIGFYNESFKARMDYDFFYRCRKAGKKFYCNPVVITYYDTNGISSAEKRLFEKEGLAVRLLHENKVESDERRVIDYLIDDNRAHEAGYLEEITSQKLLIEKDHKIMVAMYKWLQLINNGYDVSGYFLRNHYHDVAIYGMGMLGRILRDQLLNKDIAVPYVIDQNGEIEERNLVTWDDEWEPADCIVVTPFYSYNFIKERILREKGKFIVISLEDVLTEVW